MKKVKKRQTESDGPSNSSNYKRNHRKNKKSKASEESNTDDEKEGTVYLICADSIAHEILLPPQLLQQCVPKQNMSLEAHQDENNEGDIGTADSSEESPKYYTVQPSESVYYDVVRAFDGEDIFVSNTISTTNDTPKSKKGKRNVNANRPTDIVEENEIDNDERKSE